MRAKRVRKFAVRVSPRNVRSYTHKVSLTWLSKQRDKNRHTEVDRERLYMRNYRGS